MTVPDFRIIQDAEGKAYRFYGNTLPENCKWNPRPNIARLSGVWKTPETAQVGQDDICVGEKKVPVECYSRVVGYIRPVKQWNIAKRLEFKERKLYDVEKAIDGCQ